MSQYANLKAAIAANVYQNHNNEVTANMVKAAMNAMTDSLGAGYQYLGVATPATAPGTPDQKVFYIAPPGEYSNFGTGISVAAGEIAILKWDTAWHKEVTGAATAAQVTELGQQIADLSLGKFYGFFPNASNLPAGDMPGYAYVGAASPFSIYVFKDGAWSDSGSVYAPSEGNGEDIDTNAQGKLQFANRPTTYGMGYKILRRDKTFAEQVTQENTIYEIRYDFDLGDDITIPANCVLKFDGGSVNGEHTITGNNTGIQAGLVKIFSTDVILAGSWNIQKVVANWFDGSDDRDMFQKAFDFAAIIGVEVTCIKKDYTVTNTLFVAWNVGFDGNFCRFIVVADMADKYLFSCNSSNLSTWDEEYPNNAYIGIGNFCIDDFVNRYGMNVIYCADNRWIHDITVKGVKKLIKYAGHYLDNRRIEKVFSMYPKVSLDYTSRETQKETVQVEIGLGDNCHIANSAFSVIISNRANVHLDSFMGYVSVNNSHVMLSNVHTEADRFLDVYGNSCVQVDNAYLWARYIAKDSVIYLHRPYSIEPSVILNNVYIYKLRMLGDDYYTYKPIQTDGNPKIVCNNVFGVLDYGEDFDDMRGDGFSVSLPYYKAGSFKKYINGVHDVLGVNNGDKIALSEILFSNAVNVKTTTPGESFYVKVTYLMPINRGQAEFYMKDPVTLRCAESSTLTFYEPLNPANCCFYYIIRFEFGETEDSLTHYFDVCIVNNRGTEIKVNKTSSGYTVNGINAKSIDYTKTNWVKVSAYSYDNGILSVRLTDKGDLPLYFKNNLSLGDIVYSPYGWVFRRIENGLFSVSGMPCLDSAPTTQKYPGASYFNTVYNKPYYYYNSTWVDATGASV